MKKISFFVIIAMLLAAMVTLTACNLEGILGGLVVNHEFSEDGVKEINDFYLGFKTQETDYSIVYKTIIASEEPMTIKWSRKKDAETDKMMYSVIFISDDYNWRMLKLDSEQGWIYVNEKDKEYTTTENIDIKTLYDRIISLGVIDLTDSNEEALWNFVEKREAVTIEFKEEDLETVEFEYKNADNTKMIVNFDTKSFAGLIAIIRRIQYQYSDNKLITIYIEEPSAKVTDTDFISPSSSLDYTLV